ncbi:MAG: circadian clock KaiB family protein, partial [Cyanophyceae cyanobacterium]
MAQMAGEHPAQLEVVEIGEQPYLAEHYKLVAMPALVKTFPQPAQVLAGGDLTTQLDVWWPRWQGQVSLVMSSHGQSDDQEDEPSQSAPGGQDLLDQASSHQPPTDAALLQMSEEMFGLQQERDHLLKQLHFKDRILAMLMHDLR